MVRVSFEHPGHIRWQCPPYIMKFVQNAISVINMIKRVEIRHFCKIDKETMHKSKISNTIDKMIVPGNQGNSKQ